ncbi:DNA polymerase [Bacillus phage Riley]|uniref:DNA polymerase II n=3 Tax=Bequatrovirus TaxID=1917990 RepID=A0A075LYQ6_9CAUD|nr:DNA polymerase [Bacillus phage Riley]YP_009206502.1 DNA polymerase [Bacillus phage AvesoBmore]ASZ75874.1 DNA polymerase I [Bacillus phage Taffo16]ULF48767.1 DNA polymerase I [Bacillus phage BillyBob]AIF72018.1 DNA polymerase II [Bacillus phage Riley]ALA13533.1 DNA polymerase II [Bacillus phage AvesoBmore]
MKILFAQEYLRENHMKKMEDGSLKNVFLSTRGGKLLKNLITDGLGLDNKDFYIDYAYYAVPQVIGRDKSGRAVKYKQPAQKDANPLHEEFRARIVKERPDIIVPSGNLGCKALLGKASISTMRGVPQKVRIVHKTTKTTDVPDDIFEEYRLSGVLRDLENSLKTATRGLENIDSGIVGVREPFRDLVLRYPQVQQERDDAVALVEGLEAEISELRLSGITPDFELPVTEVEESHTCWVLPMYSMEYMLVNPKIQNLVEADFGTLKKFVDEGEDAFVAKKVKYEDVTTIERVREIFTKIVHEAPVVSWDLETNTLSPERIGAKPLVISICWKEGTGATIPLQHKDFMWLPGHLAEIYKYIEEFVGNENIIKVGHNIKYDMKFLRLTRNITRFKNNRDTKTMYYLLVNQDVKGSLRLSDLTYEFTDMGGYDKALEDYKKQYIEDYKAKEKARIDKEKLDWKLKCDAEREQASNKIKEMKADINATIKELRSELKVVNKTIKKLEKDEQPLTEFLAGRPDYLTNRIEELKQLRDRQAQEWKYEKPETPKWDEVKAPVNEIDGGDFNYEWIPLWEMLSPYASGDVDACLRIYNQLAARCTKKGLEKLQDLYTGHYPELVNVLAKIEATGIKTDIPYIKSLVEAYTKEENRLIALMRKFPEIKKLKEEKEELYRKGLEEKMKPVKFRDTEIAKLRDKYKDEADREFNPNSSDDKQKVMFKYTGIKLPFNREHLVDSAVENNLEEDEIEWYHYKSNSANMKYIAQHYPEMKELAELLVEFSLVKTRKQNFTYKFLSMVDHNDILHGSFNSEGTETSRLSSANPNMQNMPRKSGDVYRFDYKHPIKRMFISRFEGGALIQLDYSSLESRVMALDAMDMDMIKSFFDGEDIHRQTAALTFRKPPEDVTDDERTKAKAVSFGLAYGEVPFSFAPKHNMTVDEAEKLFKDFFAGKPRLEQYIEENKGIAMKAGSISCLQGYTRNLRDVYSQDKQKRNGALRQATNTRIQGSGAFLTNNSLIYINNLIEKMNLRSRIVLTVHDSIVIDCPPEEIKLMAHIGKKVMENLPIDWLWIDWEGERRRFPITADVEIGVTYNDMVDYNPDDLDTFDSVAGYCKYHGDLKNVKNYKNSKAITEEKYDELVEVIKSNKPQYQKIA